MGLIERVVVEIWSFDEFLYEWSMVQGLDRCWINGNLAELWVSVAVG